MTTTEITNAPGVEPVTAPASIPAILEHAARILADGSFKGLALDKQLQFALGDAFGVSGYTGNELTEVKLAVSDLLWVEAGQRNLGTYCADTRDRRKVIRLLNRTARKARV